MQRIDASFEEKEGDAKVEFKWLLHVTDQSQKLSFSRLVFSPNTNLQLIAQSGALLWSGKEDSRDGTIPAWIFVLQN
jgi:hypothetical protein